jgi:hypothetical protein
LYRQEEVRDLCGGEVCQPGHDSHRADENVCAWGQTA